MKLIIVQLALVTVHVYTIVCIVVTQPVQVVAILAAWVIVRTIVSIHALDHVQDLVLVIRRDQLAIAVVPPHLLRRNRLAPNARILVHQLVKVAAKRHVKTAARVTVSLVVAGVVIMDVKNLVAVAAKQDATQAAKEIAKEAALALAIQAALAAYTLALTPAKEVACGDV